MIIDETPIMETYYDDESIHSIYLDGELLWGMFTYTLLNDGTYSVVARNKSIAGDIVIPSTYNGKAVTAIGYKAFTNCSSLTSVVIPNSIRSIPTYTFQYCTSLTSVVIPDSVTSIGGQAFQGCSSLTSVVIPNSVTYIGDEAFAGNDSLTEVVIPDGVTEIKYRAFSSCDSLTSVVIGDSVTSIGERAFYYSPSLTSIVIPKSVTTIKGQAFLDCDSLARVYYKGTETDWNEIFIYSTDNERLTRYARRYYYSETQPTISGKYWHYVNGVPTVWEIPTYALDVKFARTAYTHPGSGQTTVGDVGVFNVVIPTEISYGETLEIPVWATYTKSGYFKLSLGAYTNANCTLVKDDSTSHGYTLTISGATGDVSVTINGTAP